MEEENKLKVAGGKKVNTESTEGIEKASKLSYDELNNIAHQLSEQVRQLSQKLQEQNMQNALLRLDYLFKIVETAEGVFPEEFVSECINEIRKIMTLPEEGDK